MKSHWKTLMFAGLMFGLTPLALTGCEDDNLDDAADELEDAAEDAADEIEDGADEIGDAVDDATN